MKYLVKHIYEKDYGCEGRPEGEKPKVEVVLCADNAADAEGDVIIEAEDAWMYAHGIKEGDIWPSEYPTVLSINYKAVRDEVDKACRRAGRDPQEVTLIAVSKTKPIEALEEAYEAGARDYGENKVQEMVDKIPQMPSDIRWHMIGHLQRNKVKYIVGKTELIHSVDSLKLAQEIDRLSQAAGVVTDILLEVNAAHEESKFGLAPEEVIPQAREIAKFPGVRIRGLMTVAPDVDDPEENRPVFVQMRKLLEELRDEQIPGVEAAFLSMGMTGDYRVAVEEGATHVRVGTGIFGARNYAI